MTLSARVQLAMLREMDELADQCRAPDTLAAALTTYLRDTLDVTLAGVFPASRSDVPLDAMAALSIESTHPGLSGLSDVLSGLGTTWSNYAQGGAHVRAMHQSGHFLGAIVIDAAALRSPSGQHTFDAFWENACLAFYRLLHKKGGRQRAQTGLVEVSTPAAVAPTSRFGKYELIEPLAKGGMAEIHLARATFFSGVARTCVIKRILPNYSESRDFVSMFIDEARITIGLQHPHIVRLFDFGQVDGAYFMAMEFVDGWDLATLVRRCRRRGHGIDPRAAAYIARAAAQGLAHAHAKADLDGQPLGIVHRDVGPQNILIGRNGDVKVTDFGIAAARNKLTFTQPGTVMGKFAYMSPEQALGRRVDSRTDVWALGVTLHEMLTARRLFAADNPAATVQNVTERPIAPPASVNPDLPSLLSDVVMGALARPLSERTRSTAALADALDGWLAQNPFGQRDLATWLGSLDSAPPPRKLSVKPAAKNTPSLVRQAPRDLNDPRVADLIAALRDEPDVWVLADLGARFIELGRTEDGLGALRTAAAVFAHRGLLVQALCVLERARTTKGAVRTAEDQHTDLVALGTLKPGDRSGLDALLLDWDPAGLAAMVLESSSSSEPTFVARPTPIFGALSPEDFARLASAVRIMEVPAGAVVVREGDPGDALFAVGRGKLFVHCIPPGHANLENAATLHGGALEPERVNLSALADGDFFGEFSFLTNKPRSATVEAIAPTILVQISRDATERVFAGSPTFKQPLLDFYKERVGELMMAKNPVFAGLAPEDRRRLLRESMGVSVRDEEVIVAEHDPGEALYLIKRGEVEVYRTLDGVPVFINKLREGQFFGEIAALHGSPRQASVRAMGDVELLRISRRQLQALTHVSPAVRALLEDGIRARMSQANAAIAETRRVFGGI